MLLSELAKLATRIDETPSMYGPLLVSWLIEIDQQGKPIGTPLMTPMVEESRKGKKRGKKIITPHIQITSNIRPRLLADKGEYVLGAARSTSKPERVSECHRQFKELVANCFSATQEPAVEAVLKFLESWDPVQQRSQFSPNLPLPSEFDASEVVTFRVHFPDGPPLIPAENKANLEKVQQFWAAYTSGEAKSDSQERPMGWCLVTGTYGPLEQRLPFFIKGLPDGQTSGTALISANSVAFESFGLANSLTSPISRPAAEGFAKALNSLIASERDSIRIGNSVYVWWVQQGAEAVDLNMLSKPRDSVNSQKIQNLLKSPMTTQKINEKTSAFLAQRFFAIALTANNARAVIRSWIDVTIESVNDNLRIWFQGQKIDSLYEDDRQFFGLYELAACAYREPKDMLPRTPTALFLAAVEGRPLPADLLDRLLRRIRVEGGSITHTRAALLKLILTLEGKINMNEPQNSMETLTRDPQFSDEQLGDRLAYHAGRLLAQVDAIQYAALGRVNATIADQHYGSMSISPRYLMGKIIGKAQANLSKVRKEKPGLHNRFQEELEEIFSKIPDHDLPNLPSRLSMQQQAIFAIGYYHQRAHNRQPVRDRAASSI